MFVLGLIIGIFIGVLVLVFMLALCKSASTYSDHAITKTETIKEDDKC